MTAAQKGRRPLGVALLSRASALLRRWRERGIPTTAEFSTTLRRLGSEYGGWTVCSTSLYAGECAYCIGVGEDVSFDVALASEFGMRVHAFDPTPRSITFVHTLGRSPGFAFHPVAIGAHSGMVAFYPPDDPNFVSHTTIPTVFLDRSGIEVPMRTLAEMMKILGHVQLALVKLNIEGGEYDVLDNMLSTPLRPTQILVEFHHRLVRDGAAKTRNIIQRLRAADYRIAYVEGVTYTFIAASAVNESSKERAAAGG